MSPLGNKTCSLRFSRALFDTAAACGASDKSANNGVATDLVNIVPEVLDSSNNRESRTHHGVFKLPWKQRLLDLSYPWRVLPPFLHVHEPMNYFDLYPRVPIGRPVLQQRKVVRPFLNKSSKRCNTLAKSLHLLCTPVNTDKPILFIASDKVLFPADKD